MSVDSRSVAVAPRSFSVAERLGLRAFVMDETMRMAVRQAVPELGQEHGNAKQRP